MSDAHGVARDQLRAFIERIERLEEEKKTIADDIKDVYGEAKSMGYDTKIMKKVVALRKIDDQKRTEDDLVLDTYLGALGMIPQIELFDEEEEPKQTKQPPMAKAASRGDTVSDVNPRLIQQVVTGMQTETGRAALIAAVDIMIEREEAEEHEDPSIDSAEPGILAEDTRSDANTGGEDVDLDQNAAQKQDGPGLVSYPRPAKLGIVYREDTPFHPVKRPAFVRCFPELSKSEYEALRESIIADGVIEPILRSFDTILDGFCRFNIARELGIEYPVIEYNGTDELLDVIKLQRSSRDWTPQQEAKIAKALAAEVPARAEEIFEAFHIALTPDEEIVSA